MSTPFTAPTKLNYLTTPILTELRTAYLQLCSATGVFYSFGFIRGESMQSSNNQEFVFWYRVSRLIPSILHSVVDHVNGPISSDGKSFRYFSPDTFYAAAGMREDGMRRAQEWDGVNDPVWLAGGVPQRGDIIGPWVIEDLQKMYSTCRWTMRASTGNWNIINQVSSGLFDGTCSDAVNWVNTKWAGGSYTFSYVGAGQNLYSCVGDIGSQGGQPIVIATRLKSQVGITGLPAIPRTADIYALPILVSGETFFDGDSLGIQEGKLKHLISLSEWSDSAFLGGPVIGNVSGWPSPLTVMPVSCPSGVAGCRLGPGQWLLKWNFTYQGVNHA